MLVNASLLKTFHCLIKIKAEIDQFTEGLKVLKIDEYISRYPSLCTISESRS